MKLEEAIVYLLANSGYGMKTEQIAREIYREAGLCCGDVTSGHLREIGGENPFDNIIPYIYSIEQSIWIRNILAKHAR